MGLLLAAVQVAHAIQQTDIAIAVVDAVPFAATGLAVAFAGFWVARDRTTETDRRQTDRHQTDSQLLELIIAHAATLRRIDRGTEATIIDRTPASR